MKAYAYTARDSKNVYELRANLEWEPRSKHYTVVPAGQTLRPARASARLDALRQRAGLEPAHYPRPHAQTTSKTSDERRAVSTVTKSTVTKKGDLEFPNEF